jgi:hypothetical protein
MEVSQLAIRNTTIDGRYALKLLKRETVMTALAHSIVRAVVTMQRSANAIPVQRNRIFPITKSSWRGV